MKWYHSVGLAYSIGVSSVLLIALLCLGYIFVKRNGIKRILFYLLFSKEERKFILYGLESASDMFDELPDQKEKILAMYEKFK